MGDIVKEAGKAVEATKCAVHHPWPSMPTHDKQAMVARLSWVGMDVRYLRATCWHIWQRCSWVGREFIPTSDIQIAPCDMQRNSLPWVCLSVCSMLSLQSSGVKGQRCLVVGKVPVNRV